MKIIKVDGCETCPYCRPHDCKGGACHAMSTPSDRMESGAWYRQIQVHDLPIPDWCPLEGVDALIKEAKLQAELHPSKDARVFARNVFNFLTEHSNDCMR